MTTHTAVFFFAFVFHPTRGGHENLTMMFSQTVKIQEKKCEITFLEHIDAEDFAELTQASTKWKRGTVLNSLHKNRVVGGLQTEKSLLAEGSVSVRWHKR